MERKFQKGKRKSNYSEVLFVTGGAGFIGSNYLNFFVPKNPRVLFVNIDCLTYAGSLKNIVVGKYINYSFEKVDIRDYAKLDKIFKKYKPTGIINFAAESHVDLSIKNPNIFVETNVLGVGNLLSLSMENNVRRFLQISTDEVYGPTREGETARVETDSLHPTNPYSASKAGAEFLVLSYKKTFGLDVVITRSSNNYGPYQDFTKVIPKFIKNLLSEEKVPLYGKGEHLRSWLNVEDNIMAVNLVFNSGKSGEIYNISDNFEISNMELTKRLITLSGRDFSAINFVPDRLGHDFRYFIDSGKIQKELGWKPSISFKEGLKQTFDYYIKLLNSSSSRRK